MTDYPNYREHDMYMPPRGVQSPSRYGAYSTSSPRTSYQEYWRPPSPSRTFSTPTKLSQQQRPNGTVRVRVLRATKLMRTDTMGKSDPFVSLQLGDHKKSTSVKENTQDPQWNEIFLFPVKTHVGAQGCPVALDKLHVEVWDRDIVNRDSLGRGSVDLMDLQEGTLREVTLPLQKDGQLFLTIEAVDFGLPKSQAGMSSTTNHQRFGGSSGAVPSSSSIGGIRNAAGTEGQGSSVGANGGILEVKVEKATNLRDADRIGKTDPFVTLTLANVKRSTAVKDGTLNPTWNTTFRFNVRTKTSNLGAVCQDKLLVEVMDKDIASKDTLGKASLDLADLPKAVPQEIALPLEGNGKLYLTLEAVDFGMTPLTHHVPSVPANTSTPQQANTPYEPVSTHDATRAGSSSFTQQQQAQGDVSATLSPTHGARPGGHESDEYWQRRRVLDDHLQGEERRLRVDMLTRVQKYESELRQEAEARHQDELERLHREIEEQRQASHRELESNYRTRQLERDQWAAERRDYERERREWELERERWSRERQAWREEEAKDVERRERARAEQERLWEGRMRELEDRHAQLSRDIQGLLAEHARIQRLYYEERDRRVAGAPPTMLGERKNEIEQLLDDHRRVWCDIKAVQLEKLEKERVESHGDKQRELHQIADEAAKLMEGRMSFIHERESWNKIRDGERAEIENARLTHQAWLQQRDKERQALSSERAALLAEREEWQRQKEADQRALDEAVETFSVDCEHWQKKREADESQLEDEKEKLAQQKEKLQSKVKDLLGPDEGYTL
eukprot:TRINITY_DN3125_c0_g1_i1.p1 TRINITY_DN3125_c0_g1~~TRINITY_DN3125_c0_g1_i1.p1  ORF type:complete len:804 (+),score=99.36 TRINITY_DN3125_c0_g1_i1:47-2413(+)